MGVYSQDGRPIRFNSPLGKDKLLLTGFYGTEAVSRPFEFMVDLASESPDIEPKDLLGQPVTITIVGVNGEERIIHGRVRRFSQRGRDEELTYYHAEVVPWFWFLSLIRDCRIFQEMSVTDIAKKVFDDNGMKDYRIDATGGQSRDFCVQYRETSMDFVSRLFEEEGIFYYFEHTDSKHTLVVANRNTAFTAMSPAKIQMAGGPIVPDAENILSFSREHAVHTDNVSLQAYDPLQSKLNLSAAVAGKTKKYEIYDYPGEYTKVNAGQTIARCQLEAHEARHQIVHGESNVRGMRSGGRFELKDHYRADVNAMYAVLEVTHEASAGDYRSASGASASYTNRFLAIPHAVTYRPLQLTPTPLVYGSQTAVVVGPSGEEIYVDKHGRVKVQFHWDREGKKDDKSSCWIRVSTTWAGKSWGTIQLPRIGQEVIVDFLEGDPDQPIITGRVYNDDQTPPYDLPANKTQSGVKSRSSKGGGTADFNEIRMEDKKGGELLYIHAQMNKQVMVENDRTEEVGRDETITIKRHRTETVEGNETITVKGNREETVEGNETTTVKGNRKDKVEGNEENAINGNRKEAVDGLEEIKVGQNRKVKIGMADKLEAGTSIEVKANVSIELKVGGNSIKIDNSGITIKGIMVKIEGTAMAEMKAPMTTVKGDGMVQVKAPMTQVNGDGLLMVKGGVTMIN